MGNEAYIIGAVRTPTGRKKGSLATVHAADLGAHAIRALIERTGVDAGAIDDVIFGCIDQIGPMAGDVARSCWLAAGLPEQVQIGRASCRGRGTGSRAARASEGDRGA